MNTKVSLLSLLIVVQAAPAFADVFPVDTVSDDCAAPAGGSLRWAIASADATPGEDLIQLDRSLSGQEVKLCSCFPPIEGRVSIDGGALLKPLTLDASLVGSCEVLDFDRGEGEVSGPIVLDGGNVDARAIHVGPKRVVALSGTRITGFYTPGAAGTIYNQGTLKLFDVSIDRNYSGTGGAITTHGTHARTTIVQSSITGNVAPRGGALFVRGGRVEISGSTFDQNEAGAGGAIYVADGLVLVNESTISGNSAAEGGANLIGAGKVSLSGTTLAYNRTKSGAAIDAIDGYAIALHSIIAHNSGLDCRVSGAGLMEGSFTLQHDGSCGFRGKGVISGIDPRLGLLAENGGETRTHALDPYSIARGAGDVRQCSAHDQRNGVREKRCDLGAYQLEK